MKILIVLSGGMDSATMLALSVKMFGAQNIETITFNYGSKHNDIENESAKKLCEFYGVKNDLIHLPFINDLFSSDLLKSGGDIPEGHYADPSMKQTVVPFRNGIMLAIAAGVAESREMDLLGLGNHSGDHAIYPDCRKEFSESMESAIKFGTYNNMKIWRPFESISKTDIARLGSQIGVPYEMTYSCYKGESKHCGVCGTCYERKEAFRDSGVIDLTEYNG